MKRPAITLCILLLSAALPAQGRIISPTPPSRRPIRHNPVQLAMVKVDAKIVDGAVSTEVKAIFKNNSRSDGEALWLFPLPPGSVVHKSKLLVNGREIAAETLGADKARKIYQAIVARRRDPLLLEYAGWGLVRARIYPVPPAGQAEVTFAMTSLLPEAEGVREYRFPFKALTGGKAVPLSAKVEIGCAKALGAVYSPTPGTDVRRKGETAALVGWEGRGGTAKDLQVFYSLAEKEFGALALFHKGNSAEGTFMLNLSPRRNPADTVEVPKTVVFVVDTSGSMQGKKMAQVKKALKFFLNSLRQGDAFNLIPFSTEARPLFPAPKAVSAETRAQALDLIERLEATGGTNIHEAMTKGLVIPKDNRMPIVLFLTDGLPTVGETHPREILLMAKRQNTSGARLFVFGAGSDVNTYLLDGIAEDGRGSRHYVKEDEDIEVKVSSLLKRLAKPALSNIKLAIEGAKLTKLTPSPLPDLFHGMSMTVLGRFRGTANATVVVEGTLRGKVHTWRFPVTLPAKASGPDWLEPLWAQRRVAHLLDMIRLYGQNAEMINEVTKLGKSYGIITPWTSHLVAEEADRLAAASGIRPGRQDSWGRGGNLRGKRPGIFPSTPSSPTPPALPATPAKPAGQAPPNTGPPARAQGPTTAGGWGGPHSGKGAVAESKKLAKLRDQEQPDDSKELERSAGVRRLAGKVFILLKDTWVDREFKKEMESGIKKIAAYSPEYFALLKQHPKAAKWLAKGGKILVVIAGQAYLIQ